VHGFAFVHLVLLKQQKEKSFIKYTTKSLLAQAWTISVGDYIL
jgi:hypothetical protein